MGLIKEFKNAAKEYTPGEQPVDAPKNDMSAYDMGDHGTIADYRAAMKKSEADVNAKAAACTDKRPLARKSRKQQKAQLDFEAAFNAQTELQAEFCRGAMDGFYFGRPENVQAIFSSPEEFCKGERYQAWQNFAADILIELLGNSLNAEKVPETAFAALASKRNKQLILNAALEKLDATPEDSKAAAYAAVLKMYGAGAPVPAENAKIMLHSVSQPRKFVLSPSQRPKAQ